MTLYGKDFTEGVKHLEMEGYPGLSGRTRCHHKGPSNGICTEEAT